MKTNKAVAMTETQKATSLYDLSNDDLLTGSWLHEAMKARGEDRSPRSLINDWNYWTMTVETFLNECSYTARA